LADLIADRAQEANNGCTSRQIVIDDVDRVAEA
jgi:hypothetical protein